MKQPAYHIVPDLQHLRHPGDIPPDRLAAMADRVAIAMPSMTAVHDILGDSSPCFDNFYATEQPVTPSTVDTIDTFLNTFGKQNSRETDALERMIFNPTPDYAALLAAEEKASLPPAPAPDDDTLSEQDRLINSFIAKTHAHAPRSHESKPAPASDETLQTTAKSDILTNNKPSPSSPAKEPENTSLTESFARVMIKNGNYARALKIISELSLKNPEKSIYFADQIRFLRKLIINENNK